MKAYRCLNCGFVFRNPKVVYRQRALNPGRVWAIARAALYVPIAVCPKCESDAIKQIEIEEKE